jgi:hypothetical protein
MTDQHRATPEQLQVPKKWSANTMPEYMVDIILELRARVEALEATHHAPSPAVD